MNVPFVIPLPTMTCSHSGCGVEVRVVGLASRSLSGRRAPRRPASEYARASSGNHWSQHVGKPKRASPSADDREGVVAGGPGPEVLVLVVARRDRDVQLARAGDEIAVGGDDDRRVVARARRRASARSNSDACTWMPCLAAMRGGERERRAAGQLLGLGARGLGPVWRDREVRAERQLLQADELGALSRRQRMPFRERRAVLGGIGVPALLDRADAQRRAVRTARCARGRRAAS